MPASQIHQEGKLMDAFTAAYIEAALWSNTDDAGDFLDRNYGVQDIAPATLEQMEADCRRFQAENGHLITDANCRYKGCPVLEYAGHDLWLTRQHHGCGYWDGDWEEKAGEALAHAASTFTEITLYVGDDGLIHGM
jgi:hypothetical protein